MNNRSHLPKLQELFEDEESYLEFVKSYVKDDAPKGTIDEMLEHFKVWSYHTLEFGLYIDGRMKSGFLREFALTHMSDEIKRMHKEKFSD